MATPLIELKATLFDLLGEDAGTIANPARLRITLCNFGLKPPVITGTAVLAQIVYNAVSTGDDIDISIWGNDQISPGATYYSVEVLDGQGQTVQTAAYQFTGSGVVDLSTAIPISPTPPAVTPSTYYNLGGAVTPANVTLGAGAGSGATVASVSGTDGNHRIVIILGTSPAANQPIFTFAFTQNRGHDTYPVFSIKPGLTGTAPFPIFSGSSSDYTMLAGGTGLGPNGGTMIMHVIAP